MSTLMSKDLNIERSSTRLHAPPGGKSSIAFGDNNVPDDRFGPSKGPAKSTVGNIINGSAEPENLPVNYSNPKSSVGNIINGSAELENLPTSSARNNGPQSAIGNLLNGGSDAQPNSARGRRQAPGGNSTLVLN